MTVFHWVMLLVVVQRVAELALARRNTARLVAEGASEYGRQHYPLFIILHASWLLALFWFIAPDASPSWLLLVIFLILQLGRLWVIFTLGKFWTTRVISMRHAPLVRRGPYRFFRHPNYLIVAGEIAALPLAFGAWNIAIVFSILNAALLWHRIGIENDALEGRAHAD